MTSTPDDVQDALTVRPLRPGDADRCAAIVRSLPEHFGNEDGIAACGIAVRTGPGVVATRRDEVVGFLTTARPFPSTAEITWMAVDATQRGRGIGRRLIERLLTDLAVAGVDLLVVLTVSATDPADRDGVYVGTRAFYGQMGFRPAYELPDLWPGNAALLLVRSVAVR